MGLPVHHRIDHEPVFIHEDDTAWDRDRIEYERAVINRDREPDPGRPVPYTRWADHPWARYVTGFSRGDVSTVEDYLLHKSGELGPVRFRFRRLALPHWTQIKDLISSGLEFQARLFAVRHGLERVDGVDGLELSGGRKGEPLTEADLVKLRSMFGDRVFEMLGIWAIKASEELTEPEKKS